MIHSVSPPFKPTSLLCRVSLLHLSSLRTCVHIGLSYVCSVLFSTPPSKKKKKAGRPGIKQSKAALPRNNPLIYGQAVARETGRREEPIGGALAETRHPAGFCDVTVAAV